MKKNILIFLFIIIILYSSYKITDSFSSNNTLYYNGNTKEFSYYNLNDDDLFNAFKDLIPGDVRIQEINIKGTNIKDNTILYLQLNTNINKELLNYIKISAYKDDIELTNTNDVIKIADFKEDDSFTLKIKIEVPVEVDNEVENLESSLKWTFLIEENNNIVKVPYTLDNSNIYINIIIFIISIIGIIYTLKTKESK